MAIAATQAAIELEACNAEISPYELISLLLDGALERIEQAKLTLSSGNTEEAGVLMGRIVGIVNGLRASLDLDQGGEIAANLDGLYEYIVNRICEAEAETGGAVLSEAANLLGDVKGGWDGMAA